MARSAIRPLLGGLLGVTLVTLAACGPDRGGSVAIGGGPPAPIATTPSNSGVVFVPLDSPTPGSTNARTPGSTPNSGTGSTPGPPASSTGGSGSGGTGVTGGSRSTPSGGRSTGGTGSGTGTPSPGGGGPTTSAPQSPASLAVTALNTADTGQRWCQRVTLGLANSGDRTATSGTVTFATHVIGALGIDWWTYQTSQALAAPVAGHRSVDESWTVCLDSWRVPIGMHMETRTASLS
ncbi:hypothetical protein ABIA32_000278 [Streptacidiphilus sp. MAP12-20]|uniref:hypothetical protein n=1 Tax=Streptacidiphilus sp. MAP12-20 TaxID=3156299 RepID=UPI003516E969